MIKMEHSPSIIQNLKGIGEEQCGLVLNAAYIQS